MVRCKLKATNADGPLGDLPPPFCQDGVLRFVLVVVLGLEVQRSMGPVLVRPLGFAALFSFSPTIQD
jgi:hypothetical protein